MLLKKKFPNKLIGIGVLVPALLSLYFMTQLGLSTVFLDEWYMVPLLGEFYSGGDPFSILIQPQNEHITFFPKVIILGVAYVTSYNIFVEIFVGWIFLSLTLFVLWRLLNQTVPEARWLIIPMAWLTYSFSQYETMLWGFPSIQWYFTILSVISAIYFLNKINSSSRFLLPALVFGFIGAFSHFIGNLFWIVGLVNFRNKFNFRKILLTIYSIVGISTFILYFVVRNFDSIVSNPRYYSAFDDPTGMIRFILGYLGNPLHLKSSFFSSVASPFEVTVAVAVGAFVLSMLIVSSLFFCRSSVRERYSEKLIPWLQISFFAILAAIITAIGRLARHGEELALASRYVPLGTLFWESTLVITVMMLLFLKQTAKTGRNQNIIKSILIILLILLALSISMSYYNGWINGSNFSSRISNAAPCIVNFESATDKCLGKLAQFPELSREQAKILLEYCLGPLSVRCN